MILYASEQVQWLLAEFEECEKKLSHLVGGLQELLAALEEEVSLEHEEKEGKSNASENAF